jgi:hypothetical protein
MPIRVAAGLVATALEEAQELPRKLTELPVTAVSQALQVSMRVQQRVTDLAIKGDRALGSLRPAPEAPTWARFDEDEEPPAGQSNGFGPRSVEPYAPSPPRVTPVRILPDLEPDDYDDDLDIELDIEVDVEFDDPDLEEVSDASEVPVPRSPTETSNEAEPTAKSNGAPVAKPGAAKADPTPASGANGSGPPGLPEYEQWSLPQLRGHFRGLTLRQLEELLAWEASHLDRPPYLTMISNRIATVTEQ